MHLLRIRPARSPDGESGDRGPEKAGATWVTRGLGAGGSEQEGRAPASAKARKGQPAGTHVWREGWQRGDMRGRGGRGGARLRAARGTGASALPRRAHAMLRPPETSLCAPTAPRSRRRFRCGESWNRLHQSRIA
eukprot:524458-Rhodomonas_salina.2